MAARAEPEVRVAFRRIWDQVEQGRSSLGVVFRPADAHRWSQVDDPGALMALDAARLRANDSTSHEGTESWAVSPSPYGPMMIFDEPGDEEQARIWFRTLASVLAEAGWSGTVDLADAEVTMPAWMEDRGALPKLTAYTALSLSEPTPARSANVVSSGPGWAVDAATTQTLCRRAVDWCADVVGAEVHLSQGRSTVSVQDPQAPLLLASAVDLAGTAAIRYSRADPLAVRVTSLSSQGQVVHVIDDDSDWRTRFEPLLQMVIGGAGSLDLAVVRLSRTWPISWMSLDLGNPPLPRVSEGEVRYNRRLWAQFTPDAHGAQVLTGAHLARAHDLEAWEVRPLAADRHLVLARDLAPWYAGGEPDPEVLAAARTDFGDMILTPEVIVSPA